MQFKRAGKAVSEPRAPLISRAASWGDFADKMRERVNLDMSDGEGIFTLADYCAPTEPDHQVFWEYMDETIDELPTDRSGCIDRHATVPMGAL